MQPDKEASKLLGCRMSQVIPLFKQLLCLLPSPSLEAAECQTVKLHAKGTVIISTRMPEVQQSVHSLLRLVLPMVVRAFLTGPITSPFKALVANWMADIHSTEIRWSGVPLLVQHPS